MGGNLGKCDKREVGKREVTSGQTRKGGETGLLRKTSGGGGDTIGAKENPAGLNLRGVVIGLD